MIEKRAAPAAQLTFELLQKINCRKVGVNLGLLFLLYIDPLLSIRHQQLPARFPNHVPGRSFHQPVQTSRGLLLSDHIVTIR